ncbi:MAG: cyclic nucleotide-binding domain-containing protein [Candidatus Wallbacteria bacterium]|nr:cyclic nucleotide-binding domain-containing protein [Candidatus Wallbacteria bacterium]
MNHEITLNQIALFTDLDEVEIKKLEEVVREEMVLGDFRIFREGDASDAFYVIKSGSVKIVKEVPGQPQKVLAYLREGDFFGEMGVMKDSPRSASAFTMERSSLLKIRKQAFLGFLEANPIIAMKVRSAMVRRYSDNVFTISKHGPGR